MWQPFGSPHSQCYNNVAYSGWWSVVVEDGWAKDALGILGCQK